MLLSRLSHLCCWCWCSGAAGMIVLLLLLWPEQRRAFRSGPGSCLGAELLLKYPVCSSRGQPRRPRDPLAAAEPPDVHRFPCWDCPTPACVTRSEGSPVCFSLGICILNDVISWGPFGFRSHPGCAGTFALGPLPLASQVSQNRLSSGYLCTYLLSPLIFPCIANFGRGSKTMFADVS